MSNDPLLYGCQGRVEQQPTDDMVRCPSCLGRGPCSFCGGVGGVTQDRFDAFHEGHAKERGLLKVELASKNLRITGLEETLKQVLEQLPKPFNSETHQVIARAERMLEKRMPVECEYPKCQCPRFGHCGKAGLYYDRA